MSTFCTQSVGVLYESLESRAMLSVTVPTNHAWHYLAGAERDLEVKAAPQAAQKTQKAKTAPLQSKKSKAKAQSKKAKKAKGAAAAGVWVDPIYMKYGDIKGEDTFDGGKELKELIELNSFQWGVGRSVSGGGAGREAGSPSISEITITKTYDSTSRQLLHEALAGEPVKVSIYFVMTNGKKARAYLEYELEGAIISGYSISSGGDVPSESLSLNFSKVKVTHYPSEEASKKGAKREDVTWDLALVETA